MSLVIYLLGDILGKLPGTSVIAGLAWSIIIAIVIKCTGILSDDIADNCVYSMNFALKALLPMLVAGIGINSLKITDLTKFFSPGVFAVIFFGVLGAFIGAMIFAKLAGLFPYEAGVTAGLCCCNIGGSGDLAVLTAADRMNPSGICLYLYTNWRCFDGRMAGIFVSTVNEIACWKPLKLIADNSLLKYYIVTDKQGPICASPGTVWGPVFYKVVCI